MRIDHRLGLSLLLVALPACASLPRVGGNPVGGTPASFERLGNEAQLSRTIQVRAGMSRAVAWRTLTEYLSQRHTIAVQDQNGGFAMTAWEASAMREGVPDLRYRTRIIAHFIGEDWPQLYVRVDAGWKEGDQWQVGIDRQLLDRVAAELQTVLGPR